MLTVLIFIIILIILVLVHEFGHFFAAKMNGIFVEEFGFGFPPRLFGKRIGETLYSVNLIPLGGFVKLYGEEYHEEEDNSKGKSKIPPHRSFINKTPFQKTIVLIAGVVMNFLLAWVLISFLFLSGVPKPSGVMISEILPNSPAETAGLMKSDSILFIGNGEESKKVVITADVIETTNKYAGKQMKIIVQRKNKTLNFALIPRENPPKGEGSLGVVIQQSVKTIRYPWYQVPYYGFIETASTAKTIAVEILKIPGKLMTKNHAPVEFAGPIGIAKIVGEARKFGLNALIELTAVISLNLAVINILPLPALDGGRLVFIFYEWISGKRPNEKLEQYLNLFGIILFLGLGAAITIFEINKYFL